MSPDDRVEKFWAVVEKTDTCWDWRGLFSKGSEPVFFYDKKTRSARRFVWCLTYGPLGEDLRVYRSCTNVACVNPAHLYTGTLKDVRKKTKEENLAKFLTNVRKPKSKNDCWLWVGRRSNTQMGYGVFNMMGVQILAHRSSWILFRGEIPKGLFVCHRCDVPMCVNPDHLFVGSHQDNVDDMLSKHRHVHGERVKWKKVNGQIVKEIRRLGIEGINHQEIANKFNISRSNVGQIIQRRTWRNVA